MRSIHIARSLLSAPRLLLSLLLWPFVIGLGIALFQLTFTTLQVHSLDENPDEYEERKQELKPDEKFLRQWLFGSKKPFDEIHICRWTSDPESATHEDSRCEFDWYDVAINSDEPLTVSIDEYVEMSKGVVRRIHVCRDCTSALTIKLGAEKKKETHLRGFGSVSLFYFMEQGEMRSVSEFYKDIRNIKEDWKDNRGKLFIHLDGDDQPLPLTGGQSKILLVFHTVCIILVALWLALRAHRRVLDYFSKNGALLPLVAACGKDKFYKAVWLITMARVGCFLVASVPLSVVVYYGYLKKETLERFIGDPFEFILWLMCLISATALLTVIASIAELKERESFFSWAYKAVPFFVCLLGGLLWSLLALFGGSEWGPLKSIVSAIPLLGTCSVIVAPLLNIAHYSLVIHTLVNVLLILWLMRLNASWFAAHLEDL